MNISKVEDFIAYNTANELVKQAAGDGMEFEIMYQAIIESMQNNSDANSNVNTNNVYETTSRATMKLDDIPLIIKGENNGQVYGREPINYKTQSNDYVINSSNVTSSSELYELTSDLTVEDIMDNLDNIENKYTPATGETLNKIYSAVDKYSEKYGVDKNLVLAIMKQESNFDPNAVSNAGAMGLMQLMDFNCETYGVNYPLDIDQNIEGGVRHIKEYLDMYDGDVEMALMAYNGGPGTMSRRGVKSTEDLYKMPQETQNYVPKVMNYYKNGVSI